MYRRHNTLESVFSILITFLYHSLVQAEYWQDPFNEAEYRKKSVFLADINQENVLLSLFFSHFPLQLSVCVVVVLVSTVFR